MQETLLELLNGIILAIVDEPEAVRVKEHEPDEKGTLFEVDVAQPDVGHVLGKQGQTAHSIRAIMRAAGAKQNLRVSVKINAPFKEGQRPREESQDPTDGLNLD